jgi:hypothetical protein
MKTDLPLDIRLMNMATAAMVVVLLAMGSLALGVWVLRHPVWTIQGITVQGDVAHQNAVRLRAQLATQLRQHVSSSILDADLHRCARCSKPCPGCAAPGAARVSQPPEGHPRRACAGGLVGAARVRAAGQHLRRGLRSHARRTRRPAGAGRAGGACRPGLGCSSSSAPNWPGWTWRWSGWNSTTGATGAPGWTTAPMSNWVAVRPTSCLNVPGCSPAQWAS